jgi:hypothetical protein
LLFNKLFSLSKNEKNKCNFFDLKFISISI